MQTLSPIKTVQIGMAVYDINSKLIGQVSFVFPGKEKLDPQVMGLRDLRSQMQKLMGNTTDFPVSVYARFYQDGFVCVRLEKAIRYFIPQQVYIILGDNIHLRVASEDLLMSNTPNSPQST